MWMKFDSLKNKCYEGHIGQSVHLKGTWDCISVFVVEDPLTYVEAVDRLNSNKLLKAMRS
jgi:hypothetical protein